MINSYSTIYNVGHRAVRDLTLHNVHVEEKVDGSQISFMRDLDGKLHFRSKGRAFDLGEEDKMFAKAVESLKDLDLTPGWVYRGEYLQKPKHNALAYLRVPERHVIIFDIEAGEAGFLVPHLRKAAAELLGLECVSVFHQGKLNFAELHNMMQYESCLGGCLIEGVVIKPANYDLYGLDKKVLMAKHVSEAYKEVHKKEWKSSNPAGKDILQTLGETYRNENRWQKAIQHLRDDGKLENSPKDIGPFIKEIQEDILKEESDVIKEVLFRWAKDHILRQSVRGAADFYKQKLAESQFDEPPKDITRSI